MIKGVIFDYTRTLYNPDNSSLMEGAREVLDYLLNRNIKMCIIGKVGGQEGGESERRQQISQLALERYFVNIQLVKGSKSVEQFELAQRALSLNHLEIAVVGDRIREEITVGNRLGMKTIWFSNGKFANEVPENDSQKPSYTVKRLNEIPGILEGI